MAKPGYQSKRRSLSVAGTTYARLKRAQEQGLIGPISGFVEELICAELDRLFVGKVAPHEVPPRKPKARDESIPKIGSGIHTF